MCACNRHLKHSTGIANGVISTTTTPIVLISMRLHSLFTMLVFPKSKMIGWCFRFIQSLCPMLMQAIRIKSKRKKRRVQQQRRSILHLNNGICAIRASFQNIANGLLPQHMTPLFASLNKVMNGYFLSVQALRLIVLKRATMFFMTLNPLLMNMLQLEKTAPRANLSMFPV